MANNLSVNPIRVDTAMSSDYLTARGASAGLELPLKVYKVVFENAGATVTAGVFTITDGSSGANVLLEQPFAASTTPAVNTATQDFATSPVWRNFKATSVPAGMIAWIYYRS